MLIITFSSFSLVGISYILPSVLIELQTYLGNHLCTSNDNDVPF